MFVAFRFRQQFAGAFQDGIRDDRPASETCQLLLPPLLGQALHQALGDKRGICRYAYEILPMDEALTLVAVDLSGRAHLSYEVEGLHEKVGTFDTELVEEFLLGLVRNAGCTLHVKKLAGSNTHHILEGIFKALGRALRGAVKIDADCQDEIPSTKGVL